MGWGEPFWGAYRYTTKTLTWAKRFVIRNAISGGISLTEWAGNMASIAGGVGFSGSNALYETIGAGYYAQANATGILYLNVTFPELGFSLPQHMDFSENGTSSNSFLDELTDSIHPSIVKDYSILLLAIGMTLRGVSGFGKKLQEYWEDQEYYDKKSDSHVAFPTQQEFSFAILEKVIGSMALFAGSNAVAGGMITWDKFFKHPYTFSDPPHSNLTVTSEHYNGPVQEKSFVVQVPIEKSFNLTIGPWTTPDNETIGPWITPATLTALANSTICAKYGAGAQFLPEKNTPDSWPEAWGAACILFFGGSDYSRQMQEKMHRARLPKEKPVEIQSSDSEEAPLLGGSPV